MLSVVMLSVIKLIIVLLSVVMLYVVMLNVIMLSVAAPLRWFCLDKKVQKGVGVLANSKRLKHRKKSRLQI
jgi:hypothetical protein